MRNQINNADKCEQARRMFQKAKAVVCDIDGVLLSSGRAIPGAKELLATRRCVFVSNNSTHTSVSLAAQFQSLGLVCRKEQFFLAGEHAVEFIACHHAHSSVMVLASDDIARLAEEKLELFDPALDRKPDLILFCRDRELSFDKIQAAANAIKQGTKVVISNLDLTHPADKGRIHTETGALWQAVKAQIDDIEPMVVIGKPGIYLAVQAVKFLGFLPQELVFLGDNLTTDAPAAAKVGIPFIHIGDDGVRLVDLLSSKDERLVRGVLQSDVEAPLAAFVG